MNTAPARPAAPATRRTRSPGTARLGARQVRYELLTYVRNPASTFFTFAFPIVFLVVFAVINGNDRLPRIGNQHYLQYYVPAIACFGLMSATYTNLAIGLAMRREAGLLRRMQATPLPRAAFVGALVGSALVVTLVSWAVMGGVGWALYGATPRHPLPLVVALVLGVATFSAAGAAVASLVPNADAAPAIVNILFFPLLFISGVFYPNLPGSTVERIASVFPVDHLVRLAFAGYDGRRSGVAVPGHDVVVLAVWAVALVAVAVRRFRWEPARSG